jgi:hypothetical protein
MPKSELLSWLNDLLKLDYTRVEQCANGAGKAEAIRKEHARARSLSHNLDHLRVGLCVYNLRLSLRTRGREIERERECVCVFGADNLGLHQSYCNKYPQEKERAARESTNA